MFGTFFLAIFGLGLPVAALGYFLISWAIKTGRISATGDKADFEASLKSMREDHKKRKKKGGQADEHRQYAKSHVLDKWQRFGGGFYGTTAFYTYIWVEIGEILSFVVKMLNPDNWVFSIGIDLLINFFINSLMNFLTAIMWFNYWSGGDYSYIWIWFLVPAVSYMIATHYARVHPFKSFSELPFWDDPKDAEDPHKKGQT